MTLISVNKLSGFLFTWFNYNNLKCDYSHPGFNASHYNTYFRHFGPNPLLSWSDRECWETHLSSLNSKIPRQTSYCSQTLASLYDLHKSPPDSECRGPFDNAANYSLEDVLLLSKIASLLKLKFLRTKQEETKRNCWGSVSFFALWCHQSAIIILITSRCLWLDICFPL